MVATFLDQYNGKLKQQRQRRQRERQKAIGLRADHAFCTFLSRRCKSAT